MTEKHFYAVTEGMEGGYMPNQVDHFDDWQDAINCFDWNCDDLSEAGYKQDFKEEEPHTGAIALYMPEDAGKHTLGQVVELTEIPEEDYDA